MSNSETPSPTSPSRDFPTDRHWCREDGERAVAAWRASGLSQRAWCAAHGVNSNRLSYWKQVVEAPSDDETAAGFVAVVRERSSPPLEILVGAARILIRDDVDGAQLRAVVEALS